MLNDGEWRRLKQITNGEFEHFQAKSFKMCTPETP